MFLLAQGAAARQWNTLSSGSLYTNSLPAQSNSRYIGAGLQYEFDRDPGSWVNFITASQLIDANQDDAYMAGGGIAKRFLFNGGNIPLHVDMGFIACAMQRSDHNNGDTILAAIPTLSLGLRRFAVNISYVRNPQYDVGNVWVLQLKVAQKKLW